MNVTRCSCCGRDEDEARERYRDSFLNCPCPDGWPHCTVHGPNGEYLECPECQDGDSLAGELPLGGER